VNINQTNITIKGWVSTAPKKITINKNTYVKFRMASTTRYKNKDGEFEDGATKWIDVRTSKKQLMNNVLKSIKLGNPVIVEGELLINEFYGEDGILRRCIIIEIDTIGHDLRLGTSNFIRTNTLNYRKVA
jgi:single-strand DNA-binding protein